MPLSVLSEVGSGSKPLSVRRCRLTTFNYASYPFLSMPSTELFGLAAVGMFVSVSVGESPPCGFIVLPGRFVASTAPALPDTRLAAGHLHLCRGDFPQCRTLSVVLLIPHRKAGNSAFNPALQSERNPGARLVMVAAPLLGLLIPGQLFGAHGRGVESRCVSYGGRGESVGGDE